MSTAEMKMMARLEQLTARVAALEVADDQAEAIGNALYHDRASQKGSGKGMIQWPRICSTTASFNDCLQPGCSRSTF